LREADQFRTDFAAIEKQSGIHQDPTRPGFDTAGEELDAKGGKSRRRTVRDLIHDESEMAAIEEMIREAEDRLAPDRKRARSNVRGHLT
jgi:hypothetical protein